MYGLVKFGYLMVGIGVGVLGSSFVLDHELNKPVGEIEEYIPREDRDDQETDRESNLLDSKRDHKDQDGSEKDISSRRGEGRDSNSGSGESRDHSEFSSGKADLYNFYSSNEARIRNPNRRKSEEGSKDGGNGEESKASSKDSGKVEMSEADRRRKEFEARRAETNKNLKTRYSKMYDSDDESRVGGDDMIDILRQVNARTNTRESYIQDEPDDRSDEEFDESDPFEVDIHEEYTLERIEGEFEVFLDECPLCETIPLTYYAGDYTLCDDGDQIIPDPEDVVGMAALNRLIEGGPGVHDEVIFVHNMRTKLNYEVMLDEGMYKESVAGLIDEKFSKCR